MASLSPDQRRILQRMAATWAVIFVILGDVAQRQHLLDLEHDARAAIQSMRQATLERPMKTVSRMTSGDVMLPGAGMIALSFMTMAPRSGAN
jgi:hypothetical protein